MMICTATVFNPVDLEELFWVLLWSFPWPQPCMDHWLSMKTIVAMGDGACKKHNIHIDGGVNGSMRTLGACCQLKVAPGIM